MCVDIRLEEENGSNDDRKSVKERLEREAAPKKKQRNMSGIGLSGDGDSGEVGDSDDTGDGDGDTATVTARLRVNEKTVFGLSSHAAGTISLIFASELLGSCCTS